MNNGDQVHFDMDGELATDGELFQVYIEELVRLTTLGQIENYANQSEILSNKYYSYPINQQMTQKTE